MPPDGIFIGNMPVDETEFDMTLTGPGDPEDHRLAVQRRMKGDDEIRVFFGSERVKGPHLRGTITPNGEAEWKVTFESVEFRTPVRMHIPDRYRNLRIRSIAYEDDAGELHVVNIDEAM